MIYEKYGHKGARGTGMHEASFQRVVCLNIRMVLNHLYRSHNTLSCIKTKEQVIAHIGKIEAETMVYKHQPITYQHSGSPSSGNKLKKLDDCHT
jgi:hypothetical protein